MTNPMGAPVTLEAPPTGTDPTIRDVETIRWALAHASPETHAAADAALDRLTRRPVWIGDLVAARATVTALSGEADALRTGLAALTMAVERLLAPGALPPDTDAAQRAVGRARRLLDLPATPDEETAR